jgi:co-chaperonin GroES (HSP10)
MRIGDKEIVMVGDRVLIKPDKLEERTKVGLYLPETVISKEPVGIGRVVAAGPGFPVPNLSQDISEPWQAEHSPPQRFIPLQAEVGDLALFLKKEAVDIRYDDEEYIVASQSAILLLIRNAETTEDQ